MGKLKHTVHATPRTAVCPPSAYIPCSHTRIHTNAHTTRFTFPDSRLSVSRLFRISPRQHTHRHSHSHHKTPVLFRSLLGRAPLLLSDGPSVQLSSSPSPLSHTPRQYHLRRTCRYAPNSTAYHLLRIPPQAIFYSSTRRSPAHTNMFTFLPDAQTPGCQ